ncbi:MAG: N-acetyl sugar amidotransferase [Ignavibacteria bacterium]|jgi:N-acetyl sugar amidotransferase|nr:N-acetyl sugar amidotransferase [Ignavibacteria bacterium]
MPVICSRCIYDENVPGIRFDEHGVCNYCKMIDELEKEYKTGTEEGENKFLQIVEEIKNDGRNKKYDCVIGVSGGTDSSYMIYKAVQLGLRPLAAYYDNTWSTAIATQNIRKMLGKLGVDLYTHVVNNEEGDDIFRSFFKASVPELDGSTDIALTEVLYRAASKFGLKYILEGHSFKTEGISPLGTMYVDGKYIESLQKQFGNMKIQTFPNMKMAAFLKWVVIKRIKKIRPFWYIKYSKEEAREILMKEFGWQYYGGHHLENRMTAFQHSYYLPRKFNVDQRNNSLSASVRSGLLTRDEALELYKAPPYLEEELLEYFIKRMKMTEEEFDIIMHLPLKSYRDYKTYKKTFEKMKPLFWLLQKFNLVPRSFYIKYTSKSEL